MRGLTPGHAPQVLASEVGFRKVKPQRFSAYSHSLDNIKHLTMVKSDSKRLEKWWNEEHARGRLNLAQRCMLTGLILPFW
jgi:hypothetical protein